MSDQKLLFCKKCGAEVEESFRFCEKCFANLEAEGAVVNNSVLASNAAQKIVENGDFIPDAFSESYDFSGCNIGNYRLTEKIGSFLGSDYYSAVDVAEGNRIIARYLNISEKDYLDRYRLVSGLPDVEITDLAVSICEDELNKYKHSCDKCNMPCINLDVSSFISSDKKKAHIFFLYNDCEPLPLKLKSQQFSIRDIIKIALDICTYLSEFERNGIAYGSIFETNIYIDNNGKAIFGAEFDRALQRRFIDTSIALGYSTYIPPDCKTDENSSVYSLAVMLYRSFNGGRLPYMNYFNNDPDYSDFLNAESNRNSFSELQMPVNAENMLGNMLSGIIGNRDWRNVKITDMKKTLENALNYLSSSELDRIIN